MKSIYKLIFLFFISYSKLLYSQGGASSCAELEANFELYQSCATNIPFDNSTNSTGENFSTTCIQEPFQGPTWFFIRIQNSGSIFLQISQVDNFGGPTDVDFVLWGPFTNLNNVCSQLNTSREIDCSWSADSIENVSLNNGVAGELYVLLIDNYSNTLGQITITQTGGTGSSDCSFLSSVDIFDTSGNEITQFDYCKPDTKDIVASIDITDFPGNPGDLRFNYKWFFNDVLIATIDNSTSNTNTITASETGNYRVEITAYDSTDATVDLNNLNVSEDEIDLKFGTNPDFSLVNSGGSCVSDSPVLQAINNETNTEVYTFEWFRNSNLIPGASGATFSPTQSGTYFARVTNLGCPAFDTNSIEIYENPSVSILDNQVLCENNSYEITSTVQNAAPFTSVNYQWFKDSVLIPGATAANYTVTPLNQAPDSESIYRLEVTAEGICVGNSNTVTIRRISAISPTLIIQNSSNPCLSDLPILQVTDIGANLNEYTFEWFRNSNLIPEATNSTFSPNEPGSYFVRVSLLGCSTADTNSIEIYENPIVSITDNQVLCENDSYEITSIVENAASLTNLTYQWFKDSVLILGATAANYTVTPLNQAPDSVSIYSLQVTEEGVCVGNSNSVRIRRVNANIPISITAEPSEQISFETLNTVTAIASPLSADFQYMLNNNGWQTSPVFTNVPQGIHTLSVRNKYGCGEISTRIIVVDYQRYFTPNGDGINDIWNIGGRISLDISNVYVFDRFGKLIIDLSKNDRGWDGNYNGNPLPADDYWFKIIYEKDGIKGEYKNHFSLKR